MLIRARYAGRVAVAAVFLAWAGLLTVTSRCLAMSFQQTSVAPAKTVGTIKGISANTITLAPDAGGETSVQVDAGTRIVRVEPGQKDLKNATVLQLSDLQVGDRILVRGKPSDDGKSVMASGIIAMKQTDVAAKQQRERQEWQRHGTGGLVTAVDPAAGIITVSTTSFTGKKSALIRVSKNTIMRRYAPDSIKFDDAKSATIDQIRIGDQLRARGTQIADGTELNADEVVAGTFRNIVGTVVSTDVSANTVTVMDASAQKPLLVKVSPESQLRTLPPEMAQRIAMRLKGEPPSNGMANPAVPGRQRPEDAPSLGQTAGPGGATGFQRHNGGPPDFQQVLSRLPQVNVADLHKGDAVMIVSTEGANSGAVTAITLLSGVEAILAASPKGGQPMILSPWSLGEGGAEEAAQ